MSDKTVKAESTKDVLERLSTDSYYPVTREIADEAISEITTLRAEVARLRDERTSIVDLLKQSLAVCKLYAQGMSLVYEHPKGGSVIVKGVPELIEQVESAVSRLEKRP